MDKLIEIVKGAIMGIANVIPGLSGGTLAVAIGIYEKLINALADIIKHPIKSIINIWPIILGIVIGICFSVLGVTYLLENYEVPCTMLFIGFILGSIPIVIKEIENVKIEKKDIISFIITLIIVIALPLIEMLGLKVVNAVMNPILLVFIGAIAALTMIVPGISGSMVLMILGYYDKIMIVIKDCIVALKDLNISSLFSNILILIPFALGILVGVIAMAKVMKWLLSKYKNTTNWAILGLICSSPFAIISKINIAKATTIQIIVSACLFILGYLTAYYLCRLDKKIKKEGN